VHRPTLDGEIIIIRGLVEMKLRTPIYVNVRENVYFQYVKEDRRFGNLQARLIQTMPIFSPQV